MYLLMDGFVWMNHCFSNHWPWKVSTGGGIQYDIAHVPGILTQVGCTISGPVVQHWNALVNNEIHRRCGDANIGSDLSTTSSPDMVCTGDSQTDSIGLDSATDTDMPWASDFDYNQRKPLFFQLIFFDFWFLILD